jgi:hypothetical protein
VRRWSKVIVREDGAECAIFSEVVEHVVGIPSLYRCFRAEYVEERMRPGFRAGGSAVTRVTRIETSIA